MLDQITRIMVIDGSTVSRQILSRILRDEIPNIEVTSCKTGAAAIKLLKNNKYDLFTTALMLPDMDGLELSRK